MSGVTKGLKLIQSSMSAYPFFERAAAVKQYNTHVGGYSQYLSAVTAAIGITVKGVQRFLTRFAVLDVLGIVVMLIAARF